MKGLRYFLYSAGLVGVCSACALLVWVIVCLTWPYTGLIEVKGPDMDPLGVGARTAKAGEVATYTFAYCVDERLPLPLNVNREMELVSDGSLSYLAPPISYTIRDRCETRHIMVGIPDYIPAGRYRLKTHTSLQVNPFRVIREDWTSDPFEVAR
jgi:hypothetical protein